nr:hypothetical protein [Deltaproteobacteria bacterium]
GENRALNASCDHFARWRFARETDKAASETIVSAMRGACLLLDRASLDVLNPLNITRGCTTTSVR